MNSLKSIKAIKRTVSLLPFNIILQVQTNAIRQGNTKDKQELEEKKANGHYVKRNHLHGIFKRKTSH